MIRLLQNVKKKKKNQIIFLFLNILLLVYQHKITSKDRKTEKEEIKYMTSFENIVIIQQGED